MNNRVVVTNPDGSEKILYEPTPKQAEFHQRTEPNVLFWGPRGSAKSWAGRWDAHMRALSYAGFRYAILRRTYPELYRSHILNITSEMKDLGGYFHHTNKTAVYPNGSIGVFTHCNSEEDVLNLLSAEFYLMFFDEISTFEWDMFTRLAASVRVPVASGLTAMVRAGTNPLGVSAEDINRYWVLKDITSDEDPYYNPNDWFAIWAGLEDNPHVDAEQYRARFAGLAPHIRKAWVDGEFALENALFDFRPTKEGKPYHVIPEIDLPKVLEQAVVYRAVDAGWYPDPTVCLWIAHLGRRHIVFHEKVWYKTTAVDISEDIKNEDRRLGVRNVAITMCDPSMDINTTADIRTIKELYEANGIPMECSINNREAFANSIHNALAGQAGENTPLIQFYANGTQGCPYLVKTLPQMKYDQRKPKAMAHHKQDHAVVSLAYYLLSHSADSRSEMPKSKKLPKWMRPKPSTDSRFVLGRENVRGPR